MLDNRGIMFAIPAAKIGLDILFSISDVDLSMSAHAEHVLKSSFATVFENQASMFQFLCISILLHGWI